MDDKEVIFSWDGDGDDLNKIMSDTNDPRMHSSLPPLINESGALSTFMASPSIPPYPDFPNVVEPWQTEEQDPLRELLFLQQQTTTPTRNVTTQVATPGVSIGRNFAVGSNEHNKNLKATQSAHTMSEKRRREKFKGKMKALEELLPECEKKDVASVLDEAIKQIQLLKFQTEWMQEQYMSSAIRGISQLHIPTLQSPMFTPQLMDRIRSNAVRMVPYNAMLHYPSSATMVPQMHMFPMIPRLLPFTVMPSSIVANPRATFTLGGPSTQVTTDAPREDEVGGNYGRLEPPSSRGNA